MQGISLIQIILIIVGLVVFIKVLSSRGTHAGSAIQKVGVALLTLGMFIAVLFPAFVTRAANVVGVGRGTDLVIYILFVAFIFYVINQYLKGQELRDTTYRLARRVALLDAENKYRDNINRKG